MSTTPGYVKGLPRPAASRPRRTLRLNDSWGDCIAGVTNAVVCTGCAGSVMSSTKTPVLCVLPTNALVGNRRVES
jgi:hypothetical protein